MVKMWISHNGIVFNFYTYTLLFNTKSNDKYVFFIRIKRSSVFFSLQIYISRTQRSVNWQSHGSKWIQGHLAYQKKKDGMIILWPCLKAMNSLNTPWSCLLLCLKRCLKNTTYQHLNELFPLVKQLRNLIDSINRYNGNMLWNNLVKKKPQQKASNLNLHMILSGFLSNIINNTMQKSSFCCIYKLM